MGNVGDKFRLQARGSFQCLIAFAQRPFNPRSVTDIEIGQQHFAVRQRDACDLQYRAITTVDRGARRTFGR